jgi:hypothetical protein
MPAAVIFESREDHGGQGDIPVAIVFSLIYSRAFVRDLLRIYQWATANHINSR